MGTPASGSHLLRRWVQPSLFLIVEAGWLDAWSSALGGWIDGSAAVLGTLAIVGLLVLATMTSRLAATRGNATRWASAAVAVLGLIVAIIVGAVVFRAATGTEDWQTAWTSFRMTNVGLRVGAAGALALVAWWRGIAAGRARLTIEDVESAFRIAVIALAGVFLLDVLAPPRLPGVASAMIGGAAVVLFAGLIGLPLARVYDLTERPLHQDGPSLRIHGHWLVILIGTVAVLLIATDLLAQVLTFQRIDSLTRPLAGPLDTIIDGIIYVIAVPLGLIVEGLIDLFHLLFHPSTRATPPRSSFNLAKALQAQAHAGAGAPSTFLLVARWAVAIVLAAVVLWLLARAVSRFTHWGTDDDVEESRDFVWSWSAMREEIGRLIQSFFARQRPHLTAAFRRVSDPSVVSTQYLGPRELYRELLRLGARHGRARAPTETPREYERALNDIAPFEAGRRETDILTEVYTRARYTREPPDLPSVDEARRALERLRELDRPSPRPEQP